MKKMAALLLCLLLLPSAVFAESPDPIAIYVNGRGLLVEDAAPVVRDNRTFLPLRAVTEELGYTVAWDQDKREVTLTKGEEAVIMAIGQKSYRYNDKTEAMDVAPYIENNRTFIPARYLGKATGLSVKWMENERVVTVGEYPKAESSAGEQVSIEDMNMSFVLPNDANIVYRRVGNAVCFYEKSNDEAGGDGFLFLLSAVKNPKTEWNNHPVILGYEDGTYYGADFRGDPAMIQDKALKVNFEKAYERIDDILMTVRVGK